MTTTRTSGSNPINVAFLAAADHGLPGAIGVTLAPGKVDLRRGWDRDLEADPVSYTHLTLPTIYSV